MYQFNASINPENKDVSLFTQSERMIECVVLRHGAVRLSTLAGTVAHGYRPLIDQWSFLFKSSLNPI